MENEKSLNDLRDTSQRTEHPELGSSRPIGDEERAALEVEDQATEAKVKRPADRRLNTAIPVLIATTVFGSPPTSSLPPGTAPTPGTLLADKYVLQTAPILELIEFHECLDIISDLSPTVRLIIGAAVLGIGIAILKPRTKKKKDDGAVNRSKADPDKDEKGTHVKDE